MKLKFAGIWAVAFVAVSTSASAALPTLTFDGSQDGALIQNFYNGGTDSYGNSGTNYGVTFGAGATVRVANGLTYLTNVGGVSFTGGFENGVSFNYSTIQSAYGANGLPIGDPGRNDFMSYLYDVNGRTLEANYMGNMTSGTCQNFTGQFCLFGGSRFTYPGARLGGFSFSTSAAIDTITFGSTIAPPTLRASLVSPVPEPSTYAMLLVGLSVLGYAARRKNRSRDLPIAGPGPALAV